MNKFSNFDFGDWFLFVFFSVWVVVFFWFIFITIKYWRESFCESNKQKWGGVPLSDLFGVHNNSNLSSGKKSTIQTGVTQINQSVTSILISNNANI